MKKRILEQRWPWLIAAGVGVAAFLSTFIEIGDWDRRPSGSMEDIAKLRERDDLNVLFILVDTMRAEHLGSYGNERNTSPLLDRLARSGVRFERHLAQSTWTKSSMASLWTGLYPARTGITRFDDVIPEAALMAPELLQKAGFHTVGLYRNGWVAPTFGFDQGFDVYEKPIPTKLPPNAKRENPTVTETGSDQGVVEAAQEFLRVSGRERWFLYLHLMDLHEYVYSAETAVFGNKYKDIYDNSMLWTDNTLGYLMETLAHLDQLDHTLIVLVSDHGEAFLERGFEGHAREVYRETTEVPFILSFPFRLDPGIVVKTRTQNVDVWPTILDIVGAEPLEDVDGRSRLPEILSSAASGSGEAAQIAISELDKNWARRGMEPLPTIAVLDGPFRYVRTQVGKDFQEELFDARDDPLELRDRLADEADVGARLSALADEYYEKEPGWGESPTREIGELELNLLRALGYQIE